MYRKKRIVDSQEPGSILRRLAWLYRPSQWASASCLKAEMPFVLAPLASCALLTPLFLADPCELQLKNITLVYLSHEQPRDMAYSAFSTASRTFWEHQGCQRERGTGAWVRKHL